MDLDNFNKKVLNKLKKKKKMGFTPCKAGQPLHSMELL